MEKSNLGKTNEIKNDRSAWLLSGLCGVLSALFIVWGYQLEKSDSINLSDQNSLFVLLLMIIVFTVDTKHIWDNYTQSFHGRKFMGVFKLREIFGKEKAQAGKSTFLID